MKPRGTPTPVPRPGEARPLSVGAVVLAAGSSSRLGRPKQLVVLDGETLVHRAVRVALEAGCRPVVVVEGAVSLGAHVQDLDVRVVACPTWAEGPGRSLGAGLAALEAEVEAAVVLLADQPRIGVGAVHALLEAPGVAAAAFYDDVLGVPARLPRTAFEAVQALPPSQGARAWLRANAAVVTPVPLPEAREDVDTEADLTRLGGRSGPG